MIKGTKGPTFTNPKRQEIDATTQGKKSDYSQLVQGMNVLLDKGNFDVSNKSQKGVIDNVKKVETGERSQFSAHLLESRSFLKDGFENVAKGNMKQGGIELLGAGLNAAGATYTTLHTETPFEKKGITPW
ncbi:hypothetical protein [Myxococcus stipitatus]|uniref:hypothetical protein n=1 Tax=Myxococcus stipitatus TaxID=83455 RepID=UPI0030D3D95D